MNYQQRLLGYFRPHFRTLALGLLCAAVTSGVTAGIAWFIKTAIDAMANGHVDNLKRLCAAVIVIFVVKGIFSFGQSYLLSLTANRIAATLRDQIYAHLQGLSLSYFNKRRTGAIMSILTNDVPVIQNAALALSTMITAPITLVFSFALMFYRSWRLTLIAVVCIPFVALTINRIGKHIRRISSMVQGKLSDVSTVVEETVSGVRIIKSFSAEQHEIERFKKENARTLSAVMSGVLKSSQLRPLTEIIGALGIAFILYLGGSYVAKTADSQQAQRRAWYLSTLPAWLKLHPNMPIPQEPDFPVPSGGMTPGDLLAFVFLVDQVAGAAGNIGSIVSLRAAALAAAKRIFDEVLDVEPEVKERTDAILLPPVHGNVKFENVSFRYNLDGPNVLNNISFEVKPGEVVALVGRSGAGKSTIADLIPRFYDPNEGRILVDGIDLRDVKLSSLRQQIGIVPQETWLFAGTLRDNIAYGNRTATDEDIRNAAYAANASFIEGMDKKLDTVVGERGIRLSGGERQRIAIARAILMKPPLLILDEATSSLDASSEALVQDALDELMKGRTTFVIAHRLSTIINADRILAMQDGRIVEVGSHSELMAVGGYYAQLYETQLRGFD